ncbi:MAG: DUF2298 domain-containing protein [Patescibacteria group bacterium]|nr:DUF2298 domain-containing protein [Patescibacteria group bacterium]
MTNLQDIFQWWLTIFIIGTVFLPLTINLFSSFFDKGYVFSKIIGIAIISYATFILGITHIAPFTRFTLIFVLSLSLLFNLILNLAKIDNRLVLKNKILKSLKEKWFLFVLEEILFILTLLFWTFVKAHQPDIHGLEKYMDFGFVNSILRSDYFPPRDMWFTPFTINYYYFGHLTTAVLTKLSSIPSNITFNLMIATLFAFTFTTSFSIGANLMRELKKQSRHGGTKIKIALAGSLTAFLLTFSGNFQIIYAFFKGYIGENPVPFWQLSFSPFTFPNSYWYPNATRFIYHTIHEFPIYSFVVSDLHGHVLDIPFVLLTIAVLFSLIFKYQISISNQTKKLQISNFKFQILLIGFLLAVMYMTNPWDGIIYFLLTALVFLFFSLQKRISILEWLFYLIVIGVFFAIFSFPFNHYFKPFVSGIGIICPPQFLIDKGKLGPFIFEQNSCQRSPIWQLLTLYGFFYLWVLAFFVNLKFKIKNLSVFDFFIFCLIILSTLLIFIPEFIYAKDIYPTYFRANTMFKLVYQSFIMLSISSGYIIVRLLIDLKSSIVNHKSYWKLIAPGIGAIGLFLVFTYPFFAISSYYGNLKTSYNLDGIVYLKNLYPTDYQAILWIDKNIKGQPVILEAQGDSYTDFARISANTGLPTVLGWTVHEWLWRGTYDIPAPRISQIQTLYETTSTSIAQQLIDQYGITYVFIGDLEYQKYPNLAEQKFQELGKVVYQNGRTKIYKITSQAL